MLPMPTHGSSSRHLSSGLVPEYLWRLLHWRQLDFEFALSHLCDLLVQPTEVAKTTKMRKQIKNQWARDDPAFGVIMAAIIFLTTLAYCICFTISNVVQLLRLLVGGLLIEFLLLGCIVCSLVRLYVNRHMRIQRLHAVEQSVEWLYAWDVHLNALLPSFVLVAAAQYCLLPIILQESLWATALANTLWLAGAAYYSYITFLGYSALPFIDRPERLVYPMGGLVVLYILLLLINGNVSRFMLDMYFGHAHVEQTSTSSEKWP